MNSTRSNPVSETKPRSSGKQTSYNNNLIVIWIIEIEFNYCQQYYIQILYHPLLSCTFPSHIYFINKINKIQNIQPLKGKKKILNAKEKNVNYPSNITPILYFLFKKEHLLLINHSFNQFLANFRSFFALRILILSYKKTATSN